jgi:CelD/BcsL family acetyltransferase involved in cellulose biosynthesis
MDLYGMPEENSSFEVLRAPVEEDGLQLSEYYCYANHYLNAIDFGSEEFFSRLPKRMTKDIEYCRRRMQKSGEYEFRMVRKPTDVDQHMKIYYDVYSRSWQKKEALGPSFHHDLARIAADKSWLRLGLLFFQRKAISAQFWLTCEGTSYIMKTVYDQDYRKFSPGKVLTAEMMKYAMDSDNVKEVDYLHGDDQYKEAWTPKRRERKGLLVFSENLKGKYLSFLYNSVRPVVRQSAFLSKLRKVVRIA